MLGRTCHLIVVSYSFQDIEEDGDFCGNEGEEERDEGGLVNGEEEDENDDVVKKETQDVAKLIDDLYKLDYEDVIGQ